MKDFGTTQLITVTLVICLLHQTNGLSIHRTPKTDPLLEGEGPGNVLEVCTAFPRSTVVDRHRLTLSVNQSDCRVIAEEFALSHTSLGQISLIPPSISQTFYI